MSKPRLHLARSQEVRRPSLSMVKKALRLFRGIPKEQRHRNAKEWLRAMESLGERHILRKDSPAKWGQPGDCKGVSQIHAPRRLGEST